MAANKLTEDQKEAALEWFELKFGGPLRCPGCGKINWIIGDHVVAPPIHSDGLVLGGTSYPHVILICENCANTQFFNAVMMGVLKKDASKSEKDADATAEAKSDG